MAIRSWYSAMFPALAASVALAAATTVSGRGADEKRAEPKPHQPADADRPVVG